MSNKAPGGYGFGDKLQEIAATSAEETYETYCTKVDAVLSGMLDRTAKLVRAYPPTVFHQAGTTVSLLYKGDANYAVLSNIGSADAGLCGWRMIKLRYPSSSSPSVWMPFEWEHPPMVMGVEYRTVDRNNGKPVYTQLVSCGALEAETMKTVILPVPADWIVSCVGMHGPNAVGHRQVSPFYYNNEATELVFHCSAEAYHVETEDKIYLYLYATQATTESYALLKYTKESA